MAKVAEQLAEKKISHVDGGTVLVDFPKLLSAKEGKRLGKTVVLYEFWLPVGSLLV